MVKKIVKPVAGAVVGFAMCFSSTVASAATLPASYASTSISPFVALSAYGTVQSQNAVCAAGAAAAAAGAAAAEGQAPGQGCVLPALDAAPAVAEAPVAAPMVVPAAVAPAGFGFGVGAILAGLIAVAGLAAVALSSHGKGVLPITPD